MYSFSKILFIIIVFIFFIACSSSLETKTEYYDLEKKIKKLEYTSSGESPEVLEGDYKEYYRNGKLKLHWIYKSNRLWETKGSWDSTGNVISDPNSLKNGDGTLTLFNSFGEKYCAIPYKNGLQQGKVEIFGNGSLINEVSFHNGIITETDYYKQNSFAESNDTSTSEVTEGSKVAPSGFDIKTAETVMAQLKQSNIQGVYSNAYSKLKEAQSLKDLQRYNQFTLQLYGSLKNYSLNSYNLASKSGLGEVLEVLYNCKYAYCNAMMLLSFIREGSGFRLAGFTVKTEDYTPIIQLNKISAPIIDALKNSKYDDLYNNASARFKKATPKNDFDGLMKQIKDLGTLSSSQLYQHQIGMFDGLLALVMVHELKFNGKEYFLEISMTEQANGSFIMEGINMQSN